MNKFRENIFIEGGVNPATTTGTASAYVVTLDDSTRNTLLDKTQFSIRIHIDNIDNATLNVNGTGVLPLYKIDGTQVRAGNLLSNGIYIVIYNSSLGGYIVNNPSVGYYDAGYNDNINVIDFFDDFDNDRASNNYANWVNSQTGGGTINQSSNSTVFDGYGWLRFSSGTTIGNFSGLSKFTTNSSPMYARQGRLLYKTRISGPNVLSIVGNETVIHFGVVNNTVGGGEPINGIYFRYVFTSGGNFWQCVSASASVYTITTTTVAVIANQTYTFSMETDANWNEVRYYINNVLVATHITNIPALGLTVTPRYSTRRESDTGGGNRFFYVDYIKMRIYLNNNRY